MKLPTRTIEKVWGRRELPAPFARKHTEPVGEIWFEPPSILDSLLVKYLFTSAKLSVQVHPGEGQASPGQAGKDECWLVLDAERDARLAIGFSEPIGPQAMREAALDGSIDERLEWHPASAGDFFYLPAGTVHAIGPGLTLVEVQQNTDITYRLYDYGRPRALHLDAAIEVATGEPYSNQLRQNGVGARSVSLVDGPYFRLDHCVGKPANNMAERHSGPVAILPLSGGATVSGDRIVAGECGVSPAMDCILFESDSRSLIASSV